MSTILIVDDMAICREPISEALRQHGHNTICAASGREALSVLREQLPDLVVLDVNMPDLDGLAVLRTIRRNPRWRDTSVLLLTEHAEKDTVLRAAEHGIQGYLLKSQFSIEELLARVEKCLQGTPVASAVAVGTSSKENSEDPRNWRARIESPENTAGTASRAPTPSKAHGSSGVESDVTVDMNRVQVPADIHSIDDLVPVIGKADLTRLVNDGLALRPLGPTVHDVIAITGSAACNADDVAKAVSRDQALCIRLLKLANSSAYSRGHLVDGVKEAVKRIGIQEVRSLVMTIGVFEEFEGAAAQYIDPHLFWEHSIACGLAAAALAEARGATNTDGCFLWGMLHDVGRLILAEHASDLYASAWEAAERLGVPLEAVEARLMLLDHCHILEKALEHWQFPREFNVPVVNHHQSVANIKRLGPTHADAAATVALANRLAHSLMIGSSGNDVIYPLDDLVEVLSLSPSDVLGVCESIPSESNNLKFTMLARSNEDAWPDHVSHVKSRLSCELRPLCVSAEPDVDAYRMFCERIASSGAEEPPNLGMIYLRSADEFARLSEEYDAQEAARGVSNLPVALVLARGKMDEEHAWFSGRRHALIRTPVRIPGFLRTIDQLLKV